MYSFTTRTSSFFKRTGTILFTFREVFHIFAEDSTANHTIRRGSQRGGHSKHSIPSSENSKPGTLSDT
ncbi:MAG TPA: hypothetical protein DIW34_01605, partial [Oribacterium sp.]|nr:hypothetical protein [Oribacterium sp.]